MTDKTTCEVVVKVLPVLNGWRAAIYVDGVLEKLGPTSHDRDVAMLYANHMSDIARSLVSRDGEQGGDNAET